ncbi:hypothetical protein JTB14_025869 [Gonioctena quinquepunctata]|nr:hypothetical protein JTB14_025869 [Gonioctena quinquepunctata]
MFSKQTHKSHVEYSRRRKTIQNNPQTHSLDMNWTGRTTEGDVTRTSRDAAAAEGGLQIEGLSLSRGRSLILMCGCVMFRRSVWHIYGRNLPADALEVRGFVLLQMRSCIRAFLVFVLKVKTKREC